VVLDRWWRDDGLDPLCWKGSRPPCSARWRWAVTLGVVTSAGAAAAAGRAGPGAVPFLDIGNHYILAGAQYSPQILTGLSASQIASQLHNPSSPVAKAIDGSAKAIIAAIDRVLHDQAAHG
jgi:hypothetical protein